MIELFEVVKERLINVGELLLPDEVLIAPDEEIGAEELIQNIVEHLFGIVHLLVCLNGYPGNHDYELKQQKSRIPFAFGLTIVQILGIGVH